jgi:hypothetical protein
MKIEFSKTQYKTLAKALFLASWVAHAYKTEEPDDEFERLEQYILAQAKFFEFKNVEIDQEKGKYYHDSSFEEKCLKHLEEFMDDAFWKELIDRLALRDFLAANSDKEISGMSDEELYTKRCRLEEPYEEEFSRHGLDNLMIRSTEQD